VEDLWLRNTWLGGDEVILHLVRPQAQGSRPWRQLTPRILLIPHRRPHFSFLTHSSGRYRLPPAALFVMVVDNVIHNTGVSEITHFGLKDGDKNGPVVT
jgi:hypothetical protein